jgi:hypothetical protein
MASLFSPRTDITIDSWPGQRRVDRVFPAKRSGSTTGGSGSREHSRNLGCQIQRPLFLPFAGLHLVTSLHEVPLRGHELVHSHQCPSTGGALLVAYVADDVVVTAHNQSTGSPPR